MPTVAEVLAKRRAAASEYRGIGEFDGQVLNVLAFEEVPSKFPQKQVEIVAELENGETVANLRTSSEGIVGALDDLEAANLLPAKLKVISGPTPYGKPWYGFEEVPEA